MLNYPPVLEYPYHMVKPTPGMWFLYEYHAADGPKQKLRFAS
jgi:hypothetical protein